MKKIFLIAIVSLLSIASYAQSTTPRFKNPPKDNTGRNITYEYYTPAYVASDTIGPKASHTFYKYATLTGARAIAVNVKKSYQFDKISMVFTSDATGRVVTFGAGFVPYTATLTLIASKQATVEFIFDGAAWVETTRTIQQ